MRIKIKIAFFRCGCVSTYTIPSLNPLCPTDHELSTLVFKTTCGLCGTKESTLELLRPPCSFCDTLSSEEAHFGTHSKHNNIMIDLKTNTSDDPSPRKWLTFDERTKARAVFKQIYKAKRKKVLDAQFGPDSGAPGEPRMYVVDIDDKADNALLNPVSKDDLPENEQFCAICLQAMGDDAVQLPCNKHIFCRGCIIPYWDSLSNGQVFKHPICPLDRQEFHVYEWSANKELALEALPLLPTLLDPLTPPDQKLSTWGKHLHVGKVLFTFVCLPFLMYWDSVLRDPKRVIQTWPERVFWLIAGLVILLVAPLTWILAIIDVLGTDEWEGDQ